jgi:acyl carrier protein
MKFDYEDLRNILSTCFPNSTIPSSIELMKIGDLEEWDSVGNLNFLLSIEVVLKVRFTMEEMSSIKSIPDLVNSLNDK